MFYRINKHGSTTGKVLLNMLCIFGGSSTMNAKRVQEILRNKKKKKNIQFTAEQITIFQRDTRSFVYVFYFTRQKQIYSR